MAIEVVYKDWRENRQKDGSRGSEKVQNIGNGTETEKGKHGKCRRQHKNRKGCAIGEMVMGIRERIRREKEENVEVKKHIVAAKESLGLPGVYINKNLQE